MSSFSFKTPGNKSFFKSLEQALGGSKFIESTLDTDFGKWSPNAVRDIIIVGGTIAVRWYDGVLSTGSNWTTSTYTDIPDSADVITRVLTSKRFANIETLNIADNLNFDIQSFYDKQISGDAQSEVIDGVEVENNSTNSGWGNIHGVDGNVRLRYVSIIGSDLPIQTVINMIDSDRRPPSKQSLDYNTGNTYFNRFSLNSSYPIDKKDGKLYSLLIKKSNSTENDSVDDTVPSVSGEQDDAPEDDYRNQDVVKDLKYKDIVDKAEELYTQVNDDFKYLLAYIIAPDKRFSKDAIPTAVVEQYTDRDKEYAGETANLGAKTTNKGDGYYGITNTNVIRSLYSAAKSHPLDIKVGGTAEEFYSSLFDAILNNENVLKDTVLSVFGTRIGGIVQGILSEYDSIFSAGYELSKPEVILAGPQMQYGVTQGGSVQVKNDTSFPEYGLLWNTMSENLGIQTVSPSIDLDEIAKSPDGSYFPELMARFAYGYKPQSHGGHVQGSWNSYKDTYVEPLLVDVITKLFISALKDKGITTQESMATDEGYSAIEHITDPLVNSLLRVLMISDFKTVGEGYKRKIVSATIKTLCPTELDPESVESNIRLVFGKSTGDTMLSSAKLTTTVSPSHHYLEVILVLDSALDNVTPLFAYKALESLSNNGINISHLDLSNAILGVDNKGHILRAGEDIDFSKYMLHAILAKSRAGKGVFTMAVLLYLILSGSLLAYGDDKPDIASMLLSINPNAFVVNGSAITSDPAGGNDIFSQYADGIADSWINQNNIPSYLIDDGVLMGSTYSDLGDLFYLRFIMLVMSMVTVRTLGPKYRSLLGGEAGISAVFDEYKNFSESLSTLLESWSNSNRIAGMKDATTIQAELDKGSDLQTALQSKGFTVSSFWTAAVLEKLKDSSNMIKKLKNAGGNDEKKVNNIFLLGQNKVEIGRNVTGNIRPARGGSRADFNARDIRSILLDSIAMGGLDAFVGYSEREDNFLLQYDSATKYASKLLTSEARNFAYINGLGARNASLYADGSHVGTREDKIHFSDEQKYFKPFLVLEASGMDSYPVKELLSVIETAIPGKSSEVIAQNSEDGGKTFSDGISFLGYLERAGISREQVSQKLQNDSDIATSFVQMLGYPGTWRDFVFDLRPEWIFSIADVRSAFSAGITKGDDSAIATTFKSPSRLSPAMKDMARLFPEIMPELAQMNAGNMGSSGMDDEFPTDSTFGQSFVDDDEQINPVAVPYDTEDDELPDDEDSVDPGDDMSTNELVNYLTSKVINKSRGSSIDISGNTVKAGGVLIGDDKTSNPERYLNWESILRTGSPNSISVSSVYANSMIAPALGWTNASPNAFFKENIYLTEVSIDGKTTSRRKAASTPIENRPVVEPFSRDVDDEIHTPARQQSIRSSRQSDTLNNLMSSGAGAVKNSWRSGGIVRKAAGAGLVLVGANVLTGGLVSAILAPYALPILGIGTGIYLLTHRSTRN